MAEIDHLNILPRPGRPPGGTSITPFRSWSRSRIASWLADHDGVTSSAGTLIEGLCALLQEHGVPLWRVSLALRDSHPQIAARGVVWYREQGTKEQDVLVNDASGEMYATSPVKVIHDGAAAVRRRLCEETCPMDFPVLHELKAAGGTDYLAMALPFSDGSRHFISWATDSDGGFTADQLEHLVDLMPLIGLRLELDHARLTTRTLLTTYLGPEAAQRVARGTIRRFDYEMINAVILYSDLRGFTVMADTLSPSTVVRVLSDYYETVAEPVRYFGGDIIKMIGDGVLAIFPLAADAPRERIDRTACGAAAAVRRAMSALDAVLIEDLPPHMRTLRAGFSLHAGEVFFGNIGSPTGWTSPSSGRPSMKPCGPKRCARNWAFPSSQPKPSPGSNVR